MACIEEFVELHKDQIDADRIYIGGCSNGGFMTMRMIVDYPKYFAAAYENYHSEIWIPVTKK